jgi:hypothetical protein
VTAAGRSEVAELRPPPWEIALGLWLGLGPVGTGILVAGVLASGALLFHWLVASGVVEVDEFVALGFATRAALIASVATGYVFFATRFGAVGGYRDFLALGLTREVELDSPVLFELPSEVVWGSRRAAWIGVAFFLLTLEIPNWAAGVGFLGAWRSLHVLVYLQFLGIVFFLVAGRAAYFSLRGMRGLAAIAEGTLQIDLLDLRRLTVFGRAAVRNCLLWLTAFSIASLVFLNPELAFLESLVVFLPVFAVTLVIAGLALWLPLRSVHAQVSARKEAELERVDAALRGEPGALAGSRIEERASSPSLADLISYRRHVAELRAWPVEGPGLGRLALFVLIPIGSWVGGALVERAVEAALW